MLSPMEWTLTYTVAASCAAVSAFGIWGFLRSGRGTPPDPATQSSKDIPSGVACELAQNGALKAHWGEVERLRHKLAWIDDRAPFDRLMMPTICNLANYLGTLPASQAHHHAYTNGAFIHALQTARIAVRFSRGKVFEPGAAPNDRWAIEDRYKVAAALGGLLHDAGKPITDMVVTGQIAKERWNPWREGLLSWMKRKGTSEYALTWVSDRHGEHMHYNATAAMALIDREVFTWLGEGSQKVTQALLDALAGRNVTTNALTEVVTRADEESVEHDLKFAHSRGLEVNTNMQVADQIVEAARDLLGTMDLTINQQGGRIWVLARGLFMLWPSSWEQIWTKACDNGRRDIPNNQEMALRWLGDRGLIEVNPDASPDSSPYIWRITPQIMRGRSNAPISPTAVKFVSPDILFPDGDLPEVTGEVEPAKPAPSPAPAADEAGDGESIDSAADQPEESDPQPTNTVKKPAPTKEGSGASPGSTEQPAAMSADSAPSPAVADGVRWVNSGDTPGRMVLREVMHKLTSGELVWGTEVFVYRQCMRLLWPKVLKEASLTQSADDALEALMEDGFVQQDITTTGGPKPGVITVDGRELVTLNTDVTTTLSPVATHYAKKPDAQAAPAKKKAQPRPPDKAALKKAEQAKQEHAFVAWYTGTGAPALTPEAVGQACKALKLNSREMSRLLKEGTPPLMVSTHGDGHTPNPDHPAWRQQ